MIQLPSPEDFSASDNLIDFPGLDDIYHSIMDETLASMGRTITLHLVPQKTQDVATESQPPASRYNPYFGRVQFPKTDTRNTGVDIVPRDINFKAHIKIGPVEGDDSKGIGHLKSNEAQITLDISALPYLAETLSVSVEGRRYIILGDPRPHGLISRRYIIVMLQEINDPTTKIGENDG
jgi:hypothetical protein